MLVPVFTSLIAWLKAGTFIKVYGLHSLTGVVKLIIASRYGKTAVNMIICYKRSTVATSEREMQTCAKPVLTTIEDRPTTDYDLVLTAKEQPVLITRIASVEYQEAPSVDYQGRPSID